MLQYSNVSQLIYNSGWTPPYLTNYMTAREQEGCIDLFQGSCCLQHRKSGYAAGWEHTNQCSPTGCDSVLTKAPQILSFSQVINPEDVIIPDAATQESLHTKLKSTKAWTEKITIHLILRDFTSFMEKTVRAVRYLKNTRSFSV
uniref:Interleukin-6 n=1 Tax=Zosterops lateralis melanops TaxID=1220523 RepID=A0A8D2PK56_ZOSLA